MARKLADLSRNNAKLSAQSISLGELRAIALTADLREDTRVRLCTYVCTYVHLTTKCRWKKKKRDRTKERWRRVPSV